MNLWEFVVYYNRTKMTVIGVPVGISKEKINREKKDFDLSYGSKEVWWKNIAP